MQVKNCTKCGEPKPLAAFNKDTRKQGNRNGIRSQCKTCEGIYRNRIEQALRNEVFLLLGLVCKKCGFSDSRALQIDHVNGGGNKEHREIRNAMKFYKKVIAEADSGEYQILCANCNWIKRSENKEEPLADFR